MRLWIERSLVTLLTIVLWGQPRMRLWIERICLNANLVMRVGSASYEAVNWKISTIVDFVVQFLVSLVWGCELKDQIRRRMRRMFRSASYEAVNWKAHHHRIHSHHNWSASYEAVNWKVAVVFRNICGYRSASYEAVNWKTVLDIVTPIGFRSASYEAVNWKT